jgi:hypothetical protein
MVTYSRREVLGAMAALFCGVALPEPLREIIHVPSVGEVLHTLEGLGSVPPIPADVLAQLTGLCHDIFVGRVVESVGRSSPLCDLIPVNQYSVEGEMLFATDLKFNDVTVRARWYE